MYFWGCFNEEWQNLREHCLNSIKNQNERVLHNWCTIIGYKEPIGYHVDMMEGIVEIYVKRMGRVIGKGGKNIQLLEEMMQSEYKRPFKVKLIEIKGGFINVNSADSNENGKD